ncbi:hypothetical protein [Urbifossiella limnaea]|uniref:Uncharacterized protein n=1 Tax=Urbifossiella limnaea TaxID=2528023 RepID=A0A517XZ94_9BACT|nr:hypothetical protein [Urbifossiella limnaea]QDU22829.1 hypothetical protein ETAA1_48170 [Urbifossiella limnaea]
MSRASRIRAVALAAVVAACGCGRPDPPKPAVGTKDRADERESLLARLVARADSLADAGDFGPAEATYSLALRYGDDPAIRSKLAGVRDKAARDLTPAQAKRFDAALAHLATATAAWPATSRTTDEVELRLLLDTAYLRDHRRRPAGGTGAEVFIGPGNEPVHPRTLEREFGEPTSRDENRVLTYGRLRFVFGPDMFTAAVFLQPAPGP